MRRNGDDLLFDGMNLHVRSGSGSTSGAVNGLGNLIIGYNENADGHARTGSHNLIVRKDHGWTSYGGFVAGLNNLVTGVYSSVGGGFENSATGLFSSVAGGRTNEAYGTYSAVAGGSAGTASGAYSTVTGGNRNKASGLFASVSGGELRHSSGNYDWRAGTLFEDK